MDAKTARTTVAECIARIASVCDGARERDDVGFSGADQWLKTISAETDNLARVAKAAEALWKYSATQIPDLADALASARQTLRSGCKAAHVDHDGRGYTFASPYDPALTVALKAEVDRSGGRRRWLADQKVWGLDRVGAQAASLAAERLGYVVVLSAEAEGRLFPQPAPDAPQPALQAAPVAPKPEGRYRIEGASLVLSTPYNAQAIQAIKSAGNGRARWDGATKSWTVPLDAGLVIAAGFAAFFPGLSAALSTDPQVQAAGSDKLARAALSGAATAEQAAGQGAAPVVQGVLDRLAATIPAGLTLYPFQQAGIAFVEAAQGRALIGDEMGLGKTVQALGWLAIHPEARPALIIVPASLKLNWKREAQKWIPSARVHVVRNGKDPLPVDPDLVIANYDICSKRQAELTGLGAKCVIIDECHYIKNQKAARTKAIAGVQARKKDEADQPGIATAVPHVIALSGTPLLNRPVELFPNLHLLRPIEYRSFFGFAKRYCGATQVDIGRGALAWDFSGASNLDELSGRLRDVLVRREKAQVLTELPEKARCNIEVELSNRKEYDRYEQDALELLAEHEGPIDGEVLVILNRLRQLAGQGKVAAAIEWIENAVDTGKPVVVFAHHLAVLDQVQAALQAEGIKTCRIDGSVASAEARQVAVDDFQAGRADVFLGTPGAAGVGLTLTRASDVLFVEREWTPAVEEQAEDRTHRIGQRDAVTAWYLVSDCSIDAKFAALVEAKRAVVAAVLEGGTADTSLLRELVRALVACPKCGEPKAKRHSCKKEVA